MTRASETSWPGFARLTPEQQRRYAGLESWKQDLARFHLECRWKREERQASPWRRWKAASRDLLRWWWSLLA